MKSPVFSITPFYAAVDKTLGHAAYRLLSVLCGFADKEGVCFPTRKMLTHLTGFDNSNLSKYIKILCRKGYLEQVNAIGNRYRITGYPNKQWPTVEIPDKKEENQSDGNSYHDGNDYHVTKQQDGNDYHDGNSYHFENQQHGNDYHEDDKNAKDGNSYHECGNDYHVDGNHYHENGNSVVMVTNRTDQRINRPKEQTNEQTNEQTSAADAAVSDAPPSKPTAKKGSAKHTYSSEFEVLWEIYPPGANNVKANKQGAFQSFNARRKEGVDFELLKLCTTHYRTHCDKEGKTGGKFVLNASTFFGPHNRYLDYQYVVLNPTHNNTGGYNGNRKHTIADDNAREAALLRNLEQQRIERERNGPIQYVAPPCQEQPSLRSSRSF